ncbi:jg22577 [Pararge aegeria aegeria]|uniref:Jg22577 protein n=1 Tax=Pararge aegeria aegeria TaxID=348720 RepID=A0A8S4QTX6_9NEOP|nr:jg22577 [Pararge aegeria aegeria]
MPKCSACGKFLSSTDPGTSKCTSCLLVYHRACVALPATGQLIAAWCCPECKCKLPRDNKCETPIKGLNTSVPKTDINTPQEEYLNTTSLNATIEMDLGQELRLFREELNLTRTEFLEELRAIRADIRGFRTEMADIKSSVTHCKSAGIETGTP